MKNYDIIALGTGSAMNIVGVLQGQNPDLKIAAIDKDEPGGICLTKGCIPTKILLYPAEVIRTIQEAEKFGIKVSIKDIPFKQVMARMQELIGEDMQNIKMGLSEAPGIDYYQTRASFIGPMTMKVGRETITGKTILLCTGSRPKIPRIPGLEKLDYHTSDTILYLNELPETIGIIGGGYIAAEYGHFFSAMGSKVTILGRNPKYLPMEEPEIGYLAKLKSKEYMRILTNQDVRSVTQLEGGKKRIDSVNKKTGKLVSVVVDIILVAAGRESNADLLQAEKGGIALDGKGWIQVNEYLETGQPGVYAFGDAIGKHLFKHVANYESKVVFYNAFTEHREKVDYHAVPSAVFTHPEIASVGMKEKEAIENYGKEKVLIGFQRYQDTGKGMAMAVSDFFVKLIVEQEHEQILGAHIIGPQASVLIQEIINLMYTPDRDLMAISEGMHIHPSLSEVVERAAGGLMPIDHYHHMLKHQPWHPEFTTHSHGGQGQSGHEEHEGH